ncbi:hypothetical protein ACFQJ5_11475 [Halomicroarcula sp. GCM10025324]|nr:hypothetical protein [Halomicroarcula sp. ZS-22-S1]
MPSVGAPLRRHGRRDHECGCAAIGPARARLVPVGDPERFDTL